MTEDLEIIVVNDGSTDGSLELLRKWENIDSRIRVVDNGYSVEWRNM